MDNKKLLKILTLVNGVKSTDWVDVMLLVKYMPSIIVKEKKWDESYSYKQDDPENYPLDLSKIETWSTYDRTCIDIKYTNQKNKLVCDVSIYDGHNINGCRTNLRFTAKLIMPDDFIKELEKSILYAFDCLAEKSYDEFIEKQKKDWMSKFKSEYV